MNQNQILVVPDIHGRTFWRKVVNSELPVVFLGDYMDPYNHEGITYDMALKEFKAVIEYKKQRKDDVILLLGNHSTHYCGVSAIASRFDINHADEIYSILKENEELFTNAFKWNNTLFTHAGVTEKWARLCDIELNPDTIVDQINKGINFTNTFIEQFKRDQWNCYDPAYKIGTIGSCRGGYGPGGPLWADISELNRSSAFQGELTQIVGHSQLKDTGKIIHNSNWYCCDSREVFVWDGDKLKIYEN